MDQNIYISSSGPHGHGNLFNLELVPLCPDYECPDNNLPSSSDATSPTSDVSSPWTDGPCDGIDQIERQLEHAGTSGIIDDGFMFQHPLLHQANNSQMFLSPECLSQVSFSSTSTYPVFQAPDVQVRTAAVTNRLPATGRMSPDPASSQAVQPPTPQHPPSQKPRPGRGRAKLPKEQLKKTQRAHTRPERCPYCPEGFSWKKGLKRHLRSSHRAQALAEGHLTEEDVKRTACPYCHNNYARPDYLTRHLNSKHGGKR